MSHEECKFARALTLLFKDLLHNNKLDSTYEGGVGGYCALAMVFAYLRNTQVLNKYLSCSIAPPGAPIAIPVNLSSEFEKENIKNPRGFKAIRLGYLGKDGKNAWCRVQIVEGEAKGKVIVIEEDRLRRVKSLQFSGRTLDALMLGIT